jgi:hypothetical protein
MTCWWSRWHCGTRPGRSPARFWSPRGRVSLGCWSAYSPAELSGLTEDHTLSVEMGRAGRAGTPLAVAMVDLDHFKGFTD